MYTVQGIVIPSQNPEKTKTISSDDQPFYTEKLANLKRKKAREYRKHRKSIKWIIMHNEYEEEVKRAKKDFYKSKIKLLTRTKPKQWYKELKKGF